MLSEFFVRLRPWIVLTFATLLYPTVIFAAVIRFIWKSVNKTRKNIAGEVALVTGSGNGLGKEIALKLAAKGCHIAVVDIDEAAAKMTAKLINETYNVKAKAFKTDIGQFDEVKALSQKVEEQLGPVTILVNNAAVLIFSTLINPPPAEVQNMVNTNLMGHIWTVRVFMDKMRELGKGHIVAVCSIGGLVPSHRQMVYCATKYGVHGFMSTLVTELYATKCDFIKTTTVFPFVMKTNDYLDELYNKFGGNKFYPSIPSEEAAEATVEGIVTNEMEVCIPGFLTLSHRLFGFLPKDWQIKVLNVIVTPEIALKLQNMPVFYCVCKKPLCYGRCQINKENI